MAKLSKEQRAVMEELYGSGMDTASIAREVTLRTNKPTTSAQVNGYRNVYYGVANGPKMVSPAAVGAPGAGAPAAGAPKVAAPKPQPAAGAQEAIPPSFAPSPRELDTFDANRAGAAIDVYYEVYRLDSPVIGYIGRIEGEFSTQILADKAGIGRYRVDKYATNGLGGGKFLGRWNEIQIAIGGPPRFIDGRPMTPFGAGASPGMRMEMPGAGYGYGGAPFYGGAAMPHPYGYGPTPVMGNPTQQFKDIFEVAQGMATRMAPAAPDPGAAAVNQSLQFAQQLMAQQGQGGNAMNGFLQLFLSQQQAQFTQQLQAERDRRQTEIAEAQKSRDAELARIREEANHRLEMERERARIEKEARDREYERGKERDREYFTQLMAINDKKMGDVADMKKDIEASAAALQQELEDKVKFHQGHYEALYNLQKDSQTAQFKLQEALLEERKKALASQNTESVIAKTLDTGLSQIGAVVNRVTTIKALKELPAAEREAVIKALGGANGNRLLDHANGNGANGNGTGNGNGHKEDPVDNLGTGDFRQEAITKILDSGFFKTLQDEWATYIEAGPEFGPEPFVVLFMQWVQKSPNMAMFATYMIPRPWKAIHELMAPKLSAGNAAIFAKPGASVFYETFRTLLRDNMKVSAMMAKRVLAAQAQQQQAPQGSPV